MKPMFKKGFIYTIVVSVFLVIIISLFYTYQFYTEGAKDESIESRIRTIDFFISDLKEDTERAGYISGYRTLIALEEYVSETGKFLNNTELVFKEAFFNGTIGNYSPFILNQSTFSQYIENVNKKSQKIGITMNMSILSINLYHIDPWTVGVEVNAVVDIVDNKGLATWNFNKQFISMIPIENLKDPLYSVKTVGRLHSFVVRTSHTDFVTGNNNTDNLIDHIESFAYKASSKAPSFLMRFEGNLSNHSMGIESMVDISFLEKQEDITVYYTRSVVDYIYFNGTTTSNVCNVENMPSWFRIDFNHTFDYDIDKLSYTSC